MNRSEIFLCLTLCLVLARPGRAEPGETVFLNGNIYTMNERQPRAEAIVVKGDRIVFVGSNAEVKKYEGAPGSRRIDLAGKTVVPGLTDSHCHIFGIGERELTLNLEGTDTLDAFLAKVKERAAKTEPGKWITGRGWIETFWKPPQFPTRADLDKIAPNNPVCLERADGHAAIANSAALKLAQIDKETPNPFGGEILRDKSTGEATGMLLDHAQDLVEKNIPKPTEAERREAFVVGVKRELSLGWCQIQNAGSNLDDLPPMRQAFEAGHCKLRVYNAVYAPGPAGAALLKDGPVLNQFDHRFTQRTIKVVFDGALGSRGAALLEPYADAPETSGYLTQKESELQPIFEEALRQGVQVETHAIGGRANRVILNLYEDAMKSVPPNQRKIREPRWRVEHAQI
ncbi:MAG: amidohydrolase, partial [Chthoniobacterales bacterium]